MDENFCRRFLMVKTLNFQKSFLPFDSGAFGECGPGTKIFGNFEFFFTILNLLLQWADKYSDQHLLEYLILQDFLFQFPKRIQSHDHRQLVQCWLLHRAT